MKFLILIVVLLSVNTANAQFQTVSVETVKTIEVQGFILAQVEICEFCSLVPVSFEYTETHMDSHMGHEKKRLFREGRLRALIARLLGRDRRSSRRGYGG